MPARVAVQPSSTAAPVVVSDEALLEHLRNGSPSAGEELVKRYYEPLMRYLLRLVRNDHAAEELHQQTWLSVLDHADRFSDQSLPGGFKAWLSRIATNKANDYWRSNSRTRSLQQGLRLVSESSSPQAAQRLEETEQQAKLRRAIEQLPDAQKQVLMLRYYGNLKFVEIAEVVGCPLNTALGRMHKAIIRLKQLMD